MNTDLKPTNTNISCLNFWDEAWWFQSLRFSDYCLHLYCYFHNVSADMSFGLLQVFVDRGNLHGTSNFIESTGVTCSDSVSHNRVQVLNIPVLLLPCSQDWTGNLQMIVSLEAQGTIAYNCYVMCPAVMDCATGVTWVEMVDIWLGQKEVWGV